ncbi:MAG: hypothetical protein ACYTEV_08205, partial [Planctomycetota bacterium]
IGVVAIGTVLFLVDRTPESPDRAAVRDPSAIDLIPPPPPLDGEAEEATGRGWIQIADEQGRLAQQYRCDFLDPSPEGMDPGWIRMTRPQLEVFQDDGSVIVLSGDEAMAFAPSSAVESGTISGDVVIRVYADAAARRPEDPLAGLQLELRTQRARLDGVLGEVTCPGTVLAESREGVFVGSDVRLLLGTGEAAISSLAVRQVQHVRLVSPPEDGDAVAEPPADAAARRATRPAASRVAPAFGTATARVEPVAWRMDPPATEPPSTEPATTEPATTDPATAWYRMVLREDVRIIRGLGEQAIEATADELHAIFGESSRGLGLPSGGEPAPRPATAATIPPVTAPAWTTAAMPAPPADLHAALAAAAIAATATPHPWEATQGPVPRGADPRTLDRAGSLSIAPPPSPEDTWITCGGGLLIRPLEDATDRPVAADGSRLELRAAADAPPVVLTDHAAGTSARARLASYELPAGRIALAGDERSPVDINGPEFTLEAPTITLVRSEGTGRLDGAGRLAFRGAPATEDPQSGRRLDVQWTDGVDLSFDAAGAAGGDGADNAGGPDLDLGSLREAVFTGDVQLAGADGSRRLDLLAAESAGDADADADAGDPGIEEGSMRAEVVRVQFAPDAAGDLQPRRLEGTGEVLVAGGARRLWSDRVDAWFREPGAVTDADGGEADIERVLAEGGVVVRLEGDRYAWSDRLELDAAERRTVLEGRDVHLLTPGDRLDGARRVEIRDAEDRASVDGPGLFRRFTPGDAAAAEPAMLAGRPRTPAAPADAATDFQVRWTRGLRIDPDTDGGRRIEVTGDVDAASEAISLRGADRVVAMLAPEADAADAADTQAEGDAFAGAGELRRIEADGRLSAIALREDSSLDCRRLELDLRPGADGPTPARLLATGDVRLRSPERRLWAESLDVTFADAAVAAAADDAASGTDTRSPEIDRLLADGDVEVRLADGRRVLGERLEASGVEESAVLTGDVLLATANAVLDRASRIEIDEAGRIARVVGGGRFRGLASETPLPDTDTRSNAEVIRTRAASAVQELEAVWTDEATWAAADAVDGPQDAGTLVLRGGVDAIAEPRLRERNRIRTTELTLVFAGDGDGESAADAPPSGEFAAADRRLARLIARGDARLESRAWLREDRADLPRVLAIDGPSIDWDQRAGIAVVDGPGRLLVRDLREPEPGSDEAGGPGEEGALPATGFGPRGTSQFTWTGGLRLEPVDAITDADAPADLPGTSRITLRDDVEVLHQGLDGRTATLTGSRLVATMARVADGGPGDEASTMAMGGPVELVSIAADGAVYVATPARDVSCERFVYDARRGVASIASAPGRPPVSILEDGAASPVTISGSAEWDMVRDRIVVAGGAGSANGR